MVVKPVADAASFTISTSANIVYHVTWFSLKTVYYIVRLPFKIIVSPFSSGSDSYQKGIASWYDEDEYTASGEPYRKEAFTAAHRSLPFGTIVKVKNLENGKSVVVRINDRGPFKRGRIIDLSYAAAREIDIIEKGLAHVEIFVLQKP